MPVTATQIEIRSDSFLLATSQVLRNITTDKHSQVSCYLPLRSKIGFRALKVTDDVPNITPNTRFLIFTLFFKWLPVDHIKYLYFLSVHK